MEPTGLSVRGLRGDLLQVEGSHVRYVGPGNSDEDAAALRANQPIPSTAALYYFEVEVVSQGRDGFIGIGLSAATVSLARLPGWDRNSYGYHGDDGNSFEGTGKGKPYGPTFTSGDVIGCLYNAAERSVSFFKNGYDLGVAFRDVSDSVPLFPTIGLRTPGEAVSVNFGHAPFKLDVPALKREVTQRVWREVLSTRAPPETVPGESEAMTQLVLGYLLYGAYPETAAALMRDLALEGDNRIMAEALVRPSSRGRGGSGGAATDASTAAATATASTATAAPSAAPLAGELEDARRRRMVCKQCEDGKMEEAAKLAAAHAGLSMEELDAKAPAAMLMVKLQEFIELVRRGEDVAAMDYGRDVLGKCTGARNSTPQQREALQEAFSLLAYADPTVSPVAHMLALSRREEAADALNAAMLSARGAEAASALERTARHTAVAKDALLANGGSRAAALLALPTRESSVVSGDF